MLKKYRRWLGPLAAVLLLCAILGYAGIVTSEEQAEVKVVFPPERAVLLSGNFDVVCEADEAELLVDGKPQAWEPFEPPLRVSRVGLIPGMHEIQIGKRRIEICVALNEEEHDGPRDWQIREFHQGDGKGKNRCAACHVTTAKSQHTVVGELKPDTACLKCHESVDLAVTHAELPEPLELCGKCHVLHGSNRPALLRAPAKKLSAERHDS